MNIAKFLRTAFFTEHLWWLVLKVDFHNVNATYSEPNENVHEYNLQETSTMKS